MELRCKTYLFCGVLLYMAYTVTCQVGGVAIGMGGGPLGGIPYPTSAGPTQAPVTMAPVGGGFNPSDALSSTGGTQPDGVVDPTGLPNIIPLTGQQSQQTQPSAGTTIQTDPQTGAEFTLQNEPYTPLGSVGNLVKVPTNRNDNQGTNNGVASQSKANAAFDDVVVKPVSATNDNSNTATVNAPKDVPVGGGNPFNPGSGTADEIAALHSSSNMGKPVDMSNFIPPPFDHIGLPAQTDSTANSDAVNSPFISELNTNTNSGPAVNVPVIPNPSSDIAVSVPVIPDPNSGVAVDVPAIPDPNSGVAVDVPAIPDPNSGVAVDVPVIPDPNSGVAVDVPAIPDPNSGVAVDVPAIPDPNSGVAVDVPAIPDPNSGVAVDVPAIPDPNSGVAVDVPAIPDPNSGIAVNVPVIPDPNSGVAVDVPAIPVTNPEVPVYVPDIPIPNSNAQQQTIINDAKPDPTVVNTQGKRKSLRDMFSRREPLNQNTGSASVDATIHSVSTSKPTIVPSTGSSIDISPNNAMNEISTGVNQENIPSQTTNQDNVPGVGISQIDVPSNVQSPTNGQNLTEEPHLQDLNAEGIYPFEGSSIARDATLSESTGVIKDMNQAIASHNITETLHLENTMGGINDIPPSAGINAGPITGTNGGPITNLVGVKPPQTIGEQQNTVPSTNPIDVATEQTGINAPGSFVIGAGLPNAQVIQTGPVADPAPSSIANNVGGVANNAGGVAIGGGSPDVSGISLPNNFMPAPVNTNNAPNTPDMSPRATDMSNMVPPPYTPIDNAPNGIANNAQVVPDFLQNNAFNNIAVAPVDNAPQIVPDISPNQAIVNNPIVPISNAQTVPEFSQNQAINNNQPFRPDNTIPVMNQQAQSPQDTALNSQAGMNQGNNNVNNGSPFVNIPTQQNVVPQQPINAGIQQSNIMPTNKISGSNTGMQTNPAITNTQDFVGGDMGMHVMTSLKSDFLSNLAHDQIPGSNQQIIDVKPGWITNIFGPVSQDIPIDSNVNVNSPALLVTVPDTANVDHTNLHVGHALPTNPVDILPPTETVAKPVGGDIPSMAPRKPEFGVIDNTVLKPTPEAVQIVPLNNGPAEPTLGNNVFTLGEHRVIDNIPSGQPARGSFADYLTQNMISTADTKPLVTSTNAQTNNIQAQEISQNNIEAHLKGLMLMQEAKLASSKPQTATKDTGSVFTSFEAPGISDGRSIAVQENFNRQPNAVSITPQSNVPMIANRPATVQQPIAGGINDVSGVKSSQNQLSFQFGLSETRPNDAPNQQNMLLNNARTWTGADAFTTRDQAVTIGQNGQNPPTGSVQPQSNSNTLDTFANGLKIGQPVAFAADIQPAVQDPPRNIMPMQQQSNNILPQMGTNTPSMLPSGVQQQTQGIMLPLGTNTGGSPPTSGTRKAVFGGTGANIGPTQLTGGNPLAMVINTGNEYPITSIGGGNQGVLVDPNMQPLAMQCMYEADPTSSLHFLMRQGGAVHRFRCALGTAFDRVSCECSQRIVDSGDCLEVHMDFNNGIVEDSSRNSLPIGNQNVDVTNKSTPLSGIALFNSNSKLTIWRYQNYDFRDDVMLKVQFRPGQVGGDRYQPLIGNCDGSIEGPSIAIVYDSLLKEVILVLKTVNSTKKELSFPINALEWNDVTYIYDGREFIGIVNGVRRYVSRTNPRLLGIIGGDIKSIPARGLIEIRDAGIILGHCPRYGYYNGAMVDIQIYTCIPKDFRLE